MKKAMHEAWDAARESTEAALGEPRPDVSKEAISEEAGGPPSAEREEKNS